jgi:hypothetical protein
LIQDPPVTGSAELNSFLVDVKNSINTAAKPLAGWKLSDFEAGVSEVISDKRDLIDIVTAWDDLVNIRNNFETEVARYETLYSDSKVLGNQYQEYANTFSQIMEWWDQNVRLIEDIEAFVTEVNADASAAASSASAAKTSETNAGTSASAASSSASSAATSASAAASSASGVAASEEDAEAAAAAAIAAAWSFDGFTPAQVSDAVLRAEDAAVRAEAVASGGGIIVVSSEEEAAALPIGTIYVIVAEVAPGEPGTPVTIVGTVGENITTATFTPTIPNATTGDTIIIAANTKAVGGSTLTAPAGFTTLVDGYWKGTQRSWVFSGPWSGDLTITADQPLEFGYAAVAVRGARSVTTGMVKDRETEPTESTTVTAPAVDHGTSDLVIGIAFERTSAVETPEQVTVNEGWTIEHYTAQGANFQTTLIGVGGTGDMVATYPNAQATNGVGVQVVAHA